MHFILVKVETPDAPNYERDIVHEIASNLQSLDTDFAIKGYVAAVPQELHKGREPKTASHGYRVDL